MSDNTISRSRTAPPGFLGGSTRIDSFADEPAVKATEEKAKDRGQESSDSESAELPKEGKRGTILGAFQASSGWVSRKFSKLSTTVGTTTRKVAQPVGRSLSNAAGKVTKPISQASRKIAQPLSKAGGKVKSKTVQLGKRVGERGKVAAAAVGVGAAKVAKTYSQASRKVKQFGSKVGEKLSAPSIKLKEKMAVPFMKLKGKVAGVVQRRKDPLKGLVPEEKREAFESVKDDPKVIEALESCKAAQQELAVGRSQTWKAKIVAGGVLIARSCLGPLAMGGAMTGLIFAMDSLSKSLHPLSKLEVDGDAVEELLEELPDADEETAPIGPLDPDVGDFSDLAEQDPEAAEALDHFYDTVYRLDQEDSAYAEGGKEALLEEKAEAVREFKEALNQVPPEEQREALREGIGQAELAFQEVFPDYQASEFAESADHDAVQNLSMDEKASLFEANPSYEGINSAGRALFSGNLEEYLASAEKGEEPEAPPAMHPSIEKVAGETSEAGVLGSALGVAGFGLLTAATLPAAMGGIGLAGRAPKIFNGLRTRCKQKQAGLEQKLQAAREKLEKSVDQAAQGSGKV